MKRIAFYAPLKPPNHPVPSGDRRMARLLLAALAQAGFAPDVACRFRSHPHGEPGNQPRIAAVGARLAERLAARLAGPARRPSAWFTYHLYYKAPDHLGPAVAAALGIPYFLAEASFAPKRAGGPWDAGHRAVAHAVSAASAVFCINPNDRACLLPLVADPARLVDLPPFLDDAPYRAAHDIGPALRAALAIRFDLPPDVPWLLAVGMMRPGDKLASYAALADALRRLAGRPWRLLVAGDGPARPEILRLFAAAGLEDRLYLLGELAQEDLPQVYAACDLMTWPAVREAYGMALLEAQAAGLPVVAGRTDGVPATVADGETGSLVTPGDAGAFAVAVASLLDDTLLRQNMSARAVQRIAARHTVPAAADTLRRIMEPCL
ncbi:glycosyltransferase involved in cell wall biosynthesis [Constrictibacter sp. MBR-5]|uniref:glycosyltransferase family 4 protein n=1 Tax=Constrictibacter sp. MBR-5 TaxID=3156467 RepID=UPI003395101F